MTKCHDRSTARPSTELRAAPAGRGAGLGLVDEEELVAHPKKTLSPPQPKSKPVPALTDDELAALMKACAGKELRDRRDEAMIRLLLDCGIRVSELCGLTVDDLDQGMALVRRKGNKVRPVYFSARTARAADRYLRQRPGQRWTHLNALFLTQRGALTPDGARERMKVAASRPG